MKKIIWLLAFWLSFFAANSQTYTPVIANYTISGKPIGYSQATPADGRTMFYDAGNFLYRPYQSPTEVLTYLNLSKYRYGNFIIIVDSGGILGPNGIYAGGINTFYMFRNGTADADLTKLNLFGTSSGGGGPGTVTSFVFTNTAGIVGTVVTPSTTPTLSLAITASGDVVGPIGATVVSKFNGQLPAYYLNYNNLTNQPVIPAQLNLTGSGGITVTGSYPNLVVGGSTGFNTAGVDLIALSSSTVGIDTLHYRKVDSVYAVNDSVLNVVLNGKIYPQNMKGGSHGGGVGVGSVTNVSVVTANGVSGSVSNPTSTPAITLTLGAITPTTVNALTLAPLATGFTIQGGTASRTLTVSGNANVSGTNTGDLTLAGETYGTLVGQVLTFNPVNVSGTNITGILKAASFPALTGDITTSAGALATTIANNAVTFAKTQQIGPSTIVGNNTGGTANELALTPAQVNLMLPVFTPTLNGLVPNPGTATGTKALLDNGTWGTVSGAGANTSVGSGYRIAINTTSNVKSVTAGYGQLIDSLVSNQVNFKVDTTKIQVKGADSIFVQNLPLGGAGFNLFWASADTIYSGQIKAGANITIVRNNDSSLTISSTGGGGSGITTVGAFNASSIANGASISGSTITFGPADGTNPGMIKATGTQTLGATLTFAVAPTISTLTAAGGTVYLNGSGTVQQGAAGTNTQVWHGGTTPFMAAVNLPNDVTGILTVAKGGTGVTAVTTTGANGITISGTWPNITITGSGGTVSSIGMSGGTTGLTYSAAITTSGVITTSGTLVPGNGGTGLNTLTAYALIAGGQTATGTFQQIAGATIGYVLTYNGPSALPTWQPAGGATPTLQQVISAGSILNTNNTITIGTNNLTFNGGGVMIQQNSAATYNWGSVIGLGVSVSDYNWGYLTNGASYNHGSVEYDTLMNVWFPASVRISKGLQIGYTPVNSTYNILLTDFTVDATSGTFTETLPTAVGGTAVAGNAGRVYVLKNSGTGIVTVATTSSQTIDGVTTQTIQPGGAITVQSNGANWVILSGAVVSAGTYTPTMTNGTNSAAASATAVFQWHRIGNQVFVSGNATISATASSSSTTFTVTLPIASNLTASADAFGTGSGPLVNHMYAIGDAVNDRMNVNYVSETTSPTTGTVEFIYTLK